MRVSPRVRRWLTGPQSDPSVRWRFWTEVEGRSERDARVHAARKAIGRKGWAAGVLSNQFADGHWVTPGSSDNQLYRPKYVATNWRAIALADLGMTRKDPRIRRTAELILRHWGEKEGKVLGGKDSEVCITGNAARYLIRFGYRDHRDVQRCLDWLVRTQKRDGGWYCWPGRSTGSLDCWEGLAAFAEVPEAERSEPMRRSIERGAEFYLRRRLMNEGRVRYPPWFRLHYPNHYYYDLLVGLDVLTRLGYGNDPRMRPALDWLLGKRRGDGTWAIDAEHPDLDPEYKGYGFTAPIWPFRFESPGVPSRWVTTTALAVLRRAGTP